MRRLLIPLAVVSLGLLVGAGVSGLPTSVPNDVEASEINSSTTTGGPPTTVAAASPPVTTSPTTAPATATPDVSGTVTPSDPGTDEPPASEQVVPTTARAAGTTTTTSRAATTATSTTTAPDLVPPADLRIIVGNAGAGPGQAVAVSAEVRAIGYGHVIPADAIEWRASSVVVYSPGFEREAQRLADERGVEAIAPREPGVLTVGDGPADLWLIIGPPDR